MQVVITLEVEGFTTEDPELISNSERDHFLEALQNKFGDGDIEYSFLPQYNNATEGRIASIKNLQIFFGPSWFAHYFQSKRP